ncbi:MAG: hypothetical protein ORN51_08270 [Akkermansiaceae bacterium]|nr:hypothetical protein [Akkermansiaceae bacterium]
MTFTTDQINIAERAQFYRVCTRTIRRWLAGGVDVSSPLEVARHLICQRAANVKTLELILAELDNETAAPLSHAN